MTPGGGVGPGGVRGIPTVSNTAPFDGLLPFPSSALPLPAATGLLGTCVKAVCIGATATGSGTVKGMVTRAGVQTCAVVNAFPIKSLAITGIRNSGAYVVGTDYPANATALRLRVSVQTRVVPANSSDVLEFNAIVQDGSNNTITNVAGVLESVANPTGSGATVLRTYWLTVPVPANQASFTLLLDSTGSSGTFSAVSVGLDAWDVP